jgi:hypothetical protein
LKSNLKCNPKPLKIRIHAILINIALPILVQLPIKSLAAEEVTTCRALLMLTRDCSTQSSRNRMLSCAPQKEAVRLTKARPKRLLTNPFEIGKSLKTT